jgi:DNA-binding transcriptional regulator YhcF (GntR family)
MSPCTTPQHDVPIVIQLFNTVFDSMTEKEMEQPRSIPSLLLPKVPVLH